MNYSKQLLETIEIITKTKSMFVSVAFRVFIIFHLYLMVNSHVVIPTNTDRVKNVYDTVEEDAGEPLFLTSYIKAGKIEEGKSASRVGPILPDDDIVSYSGFFTVNEEFNSYLFFWFFLSEQNPEKVPVLLWLNGCPGFSSLYGLFMENGPYQLKSNDKLIRRKYAWTNEFNVLYFDQPVGTGFSFTQDDAGYTRNQDDVVKDMYNVLVQFFQLFPEYSQNEFYLTGESYAGKFLTSIAYEIHKKNSDITKPININLKGCLIGNGFIDTDHINMRSEQLYQLGFLDLKTSKVVHDLEDITKTYIRAGDYAEAFNVYYDPWDASYSFPRIFEYSYTNADTASYSIEKLFENNYIRKCVHVGNLKYIKNNYDVFYSMSFDFLQSAALVFSELLNYYKILHYSGQLDTVCSYLETRSFLQSLHFNGAIEYYESDLILWYDELGIQAGQYKVAGNLTDLLVLNAGHMVPHDQPRRSLQMVREFINGKFS